MKATHYYLLGCACFALAAFLEVGVAFCMAVIGMGFILAAIFKADI